MKKDIILPSELFGITKLHELIEDQQAELVNIKKSFKKVWKELVDTRGENERLLKELEKFSKEINNVKTKKD